MTRDGIYKLAAHHKTAGALTDSAALLGTLAVLGITVPAFGAGWALGKWTSPRHTDMNNLQKQYRLARLRNDRLQLLIRQQQLQALEEAKRKSVYGMVG